MKRFRLLVAFMASVTILAACKGDKGPSPALNFINGSFPFGLYRLAYYEGVQNIEYDVTLEFISEKDPEGNYVINGKSCLNFFFGKFTINSGNKTIEISEVATTKIDGPEQKISFEADFFKRLGKVTHYNIGQSGSSLVLYLDDDSKTYLSLVPVTEE